MPPAGNAHYLADVFAVMKRNIDGTVPAQRLWNLDSRRQKECPRKRRAPRPSRIHPNHPVHHPDGVSVEAAPRPVRFVAPSRSSARATRPSPRRQRRQGQLALPANNGQPRPSRP